VSVTPTRATVAVAVGFTAFAAARHDRRIVAYLLVVAALGALVRVVHRRGRPLPLRLQWALAVSAALHLLGGLAPSPTPGAPVFYETWIVTGVLKYDQLVHFTISAVVTVVAAHVLGAWLDEARTPPAAKAALAALVALGFGAGNEVFEFLSALRFHDAFVGGLDNAGWDLVFDAFGAATAAVLLATAATAGAGRRASRRSSPAPARG
jgi:putative membrane protein